MGGHFCSVAYADVLCLFGSCWLSSCLLNHCGGLEQARTCLVKLLPREINVAAALEWLLTSVTLFSPTKLLCCLHSKLVPISAAQVNKRLYLFRKHR